MATTRNIGPVTTAATGGAALAGIVCWLAEIIFAVEVPTDVQGYLAVVFVILAGWAVPSSNGRYEA